MTIPDETAVLALMLTPGVGRGAINRALRAVQTAGRTPGELAALPGDALRTVLPPGSDRLADCIAVAGGTAAGHAAALLARAAQAGVKVLPAWEARYPASVHAHLGREAPPLLFAAGNTSLLDGELLAVVGARKASLGGLALAEACAEACAARGACVVSGAADGVDSAAHLAVLAAGGATIAVLPEGLLRYCMPRALRTPFDEGRVLLLSEWPPDQPWETHAAVRRNATISALAGAVAVIEPRKTGGSVRTARCALDMGKPVFVHGARRDGGVTAALCHAGAEPLVKDGGQFDPGRLFDLQRALPPRRPRQADLF